MNSSKNIEISSRIISDLGKLIEDSGEDSPKLNDIIDKLETAESDDADETINLVRQYIGYLNEEGIIYVEILNAFEKLRTIYSAKDKLSVEITGKLDELF